jgi:outer membrane biosynthesis protein TonB
MARLAESHPLVVALVLSLLIHLLLLGIWKAGDQFGWWKHTPDWLNQWTRWLARTHVRVFPRLVEARSQPPPAKAVTIPLTFVEVDPDTVTKDAPEDAKYYSSKNAKASNPDPAVELEKPKIDGKQDKVVRVMDNDKPKPFPLQPSAPPQPKPEEPVPPPPKPEVKPGDMATRKPTEGIDASTDSGQEQNKPRERPRKLADARAARGMLQGQQIREDGGVSNRGRVAFNTKATPFGEYDAAFIAAVEQCWHRLLEDHRGNQRSGWVVVDFKLNSDGRITDLNIQSNNTGEIYGMICQRAILDPAPYQKWPPEMLRVIGSNTREIRFTFYYN